MHLRSGKEIFRSEPEPPKKKKKVEASERSTTPDGEPLGTMDFATMHRTSGTPGLTKDFASGYHMPKEEGLLEEEQKELKAHGLQGKFRILELSDDSYRCHDLTFHNGIVGQDGMISPEKAQEYLDTHFQILGSKEKFQNNPSLYDDLARRLEEDKEKKRESCVAVYKEFGKILHSAPVAEVYQKENGKYSIKLFTKLGDKGPLGTHDIEDVPEEYCTMQGTTNWEIHFTDRPNGRIMDL